MKKTVVANWGHAQQGKSDTIKRVAKKILKHFSKAISTPPTVDFSKDIKIIIAIGKIKIGIESQGDPNSRLFESLKEFSRLKCDLIICSTRTSGATVNAVDNLHKSNGYDIIWATNYRSNEKSQNIINDISAEQIFELVQKILAGII